MAPAILSRDLSRWVAIVAVAGLLMNPAATAASTSGCDVFDLERLSDVHRQWAEDAAAHVTFPCDRLELGESRIQVVVEELAGPRGFNSAGGWLIQLDEDLVTPTAWRKVFLHELGHSIDKLALTDDDRAEIRRIFHDGHDDAHCWLEHECDWEYRIGEAFADAFVLAFSDIDPRTAEERCPVRGRCRRLPHWPTKERVDLIRQALTRSG